MISVCIVTYNGEKYIRDQLLSILSQLGDEDEVIVSDDGSIDRTLDLVRDIGDSRVKILLHEKPTNPYRGAYRNIYYVYRNVENALKAASGSYIFLADQDDVWLPNKVQRVMQEFDRGAVCILHNNIVVDKDLCVLSESYFDFSKPSFNLIRIIARCPFQGASMAFTREVALNSLPFPKNPISHDHWIAYNAYFRRKPMALIRDPLLLYRRHGSNVSPSSEKSPNSLWFKISYRFRLIWAALSVIFCNRESKHK